MQRREILKFEPAVDKREGEKNWEEILKSLLTSCHNSGRGSYDKDLRNVRNKENGCYKD